MTSRKSNLSVITHAHMMHGFVCDGLYLMVTVNIQKFFKSGKNAMNNK